MFVGSNTGSAVSTKLGPNFKTSGLQRFCCCMATWQPLLKFHAVAREKGANLDFLNRPQKAYIFSPQNRKIKEHLGHVQINHTQKIPWSSIYPAELACSPHDSFDCIYQPLMGQGSRYKPPDEGNLEKLWVLAIYWTLPFCSNETSLLEWSLWIYAFL